MFYGNPAFDESPYVEWRESRINKLIQILGGKEWFVEKEILEVGCAHGQTGIYLKSLGAKVTFAEGRPEFLEITKQRSNASGHILKQQFWSLTNDPVRQIQSPPPPQPPLLGSYIILDQDQDWSEVFGDKKFDLIVHWGVLYHLEHWKRDLEITIKHAHKICLETEVTDSTDPDLVVTRAEQGSDQAIHGVGSYPSVAAIEKVFVDNGCQFKRFDNTDINFGPYQYDWAPQNTGRPSHHYAGGQRRYWMIDSKR